MARAAAPLESSPPRSAPAAPSPTPTAILDAAEDLFATQGFAATSIKQIGNRARANTALLYYYFGDKAGLYRAVLDRLAEALSHSARSHLGTTQSAEAVIAALIQAQVELITRHPRAAALIIREMVDHQAKHAQPMILRLASELFRPATAAIERGKAAGTVRRDLDAGFATVSTLAQLVYFVLAQPLIRQLLGHPAPYPTATDIRDFGRHAEAFALAAIAPAAEPPAGGRAPATRPSPQKRKRR